MQPDCAVAQARELLWRMGDDQPCAAVLSQAVEGRLTLRELSDRYTDQVLELTGGNKQQAARILGIDRRTLYRRAERDAAGAIGASEVSGEVLRRD